MNTKQKTKKPWQHEDVLKGMYHDQGLTMAEIGKIFGVSAVTIKYWMDKFDIQSRDYDIGELYRGKERDKDYCKHLSEVAKARFSNPENHPMFGKQHSDETKRLMSEIRKRKMKEAREQKQEDSEE